MKLSRYGFSLIELLLATAITTFLTLIAITQSLGLVKGQMYYLTRSNLTQDNLLEANYFTNLLEGIGGGSVRSWMAVWVEDNCLARGPLPNCLGSDRLTLVTSMPVPQECSIVGQTGTTLIVSSSGSCCLNSFFGGGRSGQVVVINGNDFAQVYAIKLVAPACGLSYVDGQAGFANGNKWSTALPGIWSGGTVAAVNVTTYYIDQNHNLLEWSDLNNNNVIDKLENLTMANGIYDFEVALGFDVAGNGALVDSASATDYWLYNAVGDTVLGAAGVFVNTQSNQFTALEIGLMSGVSNTFNSLPSSSLQILNGPVVRAPGVDLRKLSFKIKPRNSYEFR